MLINLPDFILELVPMAGVEPAQLSPPPPQDGVSTNFTTSAYCVEYTPINQRCIASVSFTHPMAALPVVSGLTRAELLFLPREFVVHHRRRWVRFQSAHRMARVQALH